MAGKTISVPDRRPAVIYAAMLVPFGVRLGCFGVIVGKTIDLERRQRDRRMGTQACYAQKHRWPRCLWGSINLRKIFEGEHWRVRELEPRAARLVKKLAGVRILNAGRPYGESPQERGRRGGTRAKQLRLGVHGMSPEEHRAAGKRAHVTGLAKLTLEENIANGKKAYAASLAKRTARERRAAGSRGGKISSHNRWHTDRNQFNNNCSLCWDEIKREKSNSS